MGVALYLGRQTAYLIDALKTSGQFTLEVWKNWFWFRDPDDYTSGLAPNAWWLLKGLGAVTLFALGWSLLRTSMRMRD